MKKVNTKKLATASILCAVAVVGSLFSLSRVRQQVRAGAAW